MFDVLVERKHPRLIEVFDRLECSLGGLTGEWFSRMFTTALPAETTARVWDCVMVEGPKVLFRAALSLIKMNEPALLNTCHSVQVSRILKWRVARSYQADVLLKVSHPSQLLRNSCITAARNQTQFTSVIIIFAEVLLRVIYSQPTQSSIGRPCLDC